MNKVELNNILNQLIANLSFMNVWECSRYVSSCIFDVFVELFYL